MGESLTPVRPPVEAYVVIPIDWIRSIKEGDPVVGRKVAVKGTTTAGFRISPSRGFWMYLQDETGAIAVYQADTYYSGIRPGFTGTPYHVVGSVGIQGGTVWLFPGGRGFAIRPF